MTSLIHSDWYQQYGRAGPSLVTVQSHMVMWSVDTLPQLFEVLLLNCTFLYSLIEDMIVLGSWLCCGGA